MFDALEHPGTWFPPAQCMRHIFFVCIWNYGLRNVFFSLHKCIGGAFAIARYV